MKSGKILPCSKKGEGVIGMSFGMIFSILLIIFFIVAAFIVINAFLKTQRCAQIGIFTNHFKEVIKNAFESQRDESLLTGVLPVNLEYVCFTNLSKEISVLDDMKKVADNIGIFRGKDANMVFYPREKACDMPYAKVEHLSMDRITGLKNLRCFKIIKGKVEIQINKELNEKLVRLDG